MGVDEADPMKESYSRASVIKMFSATFLPICEMLIVRGDVDRRALSDVLYRNSQTEPESDWSLFVQAIANTLSERIDLTVIPEEKISSNIINLHTGKAV